MNFLFSNPINKKFVEIINYRGKIRPQISIYRHCYNNNYKKYKWLLFYDIDEFIHVSAYSNIKDYLAQPKFIKCQSIYLNWNLHTDNDLFYYDNRSLFKRFPKVIQNKNFCIGKSMVRGNIKNIIIIRVHLLDFKLKRCDGFGQPIHINNIFCKIPDYKYNFIDHYIYKSTEEFSQKLNLKGDCLFNNDIKLKYKKIFEYFRDNKVNNDKIEYIAQKSGLNSTYIKLQLIIHENFLLNISII